MSGFAHAADPFLQNVGKLVEAIMENWVSEDHFDDFGVILRAWRVQNGANSVFFDENLTNLNLEIELDLFPLTPSPESSILYRKRGRRHGRSH